VKAPLTNPKINNRKLCSIQIKLDLRHIQTRQNDNPIINLTAPKRASQNQQLEAVQNVNEA